MKKRDRRKAAQLTIEAKLCPSERLTILDLLPPKGRLGTVRLTNRLRERLSFQEGEETIIRKLTGKCEACGRGATERIPLAVLDDKVKARRFTFSTFEGQLVTSKLQKLDEDEELEPKHERLWDVFVREESPRLKPEAAGGGERED
jgi:hypothetical protein